MNEPTPEELIESEDFLSAFPIPVFTEDELLREITRDRWDILPTVPEGL